jgi:hypothetical protein
MNISEKEFLSWEDYCRAMKTGKWKRILKRIEISQIKKISFSIHLGLPHM